MIRLRKRNQRQSVLFALQTAQLVLTAFPVACAYQSFMRSSTSSSSATVAMNNLIENPDFQAFCKRERPFVCIPNAFTDDPTLLGDLKLDATTLKLNGFGATAGVASSGNSKNKNDKCNESSEASFKEFKEGELKKQPTSEIIRSNVHQIWLSSPGIGAKSRNPLQNVFCGNMDARQSLLRLVEHLTCAIQQQATADVSPAVMDGNFFNRYASLDPAISPELSYLLYEPGAYYQKHVDLIQKHNTALLNVEHERVVSMILYLGHDNDDEIAYDNLVDGGSLRIYQDEKDISKYEEGCAEELFQDILPLSNTLVLLDSATVSHEVLETLTRSRVCVVGWFHGFPLPEI